MDNNPNPCGDDDIACTPLSPRSCIYVTGGGSIRFRDCAIVNPPSGEERGIRVDTHGRGIYEGGGEC